MTRARIAAWGVAVAAVALAGCSAEASRSGTTSGEGASFGQGSPRPACREVLDPDRVPYAAVPVVVAGDWGEPVQVAPPVTDACPNDAITVSADGGTLYFFWSPVVNGSDSELLAPETGTYVASRVGDDPGLFGEPTYLDLSRGAEGGSVDGAVSVTADGSEVYFHSTRAANLGYQADPPTDDYLDIYAAPVVDGVPGPARNVGAPVNSVYRDGEHTLSPDGQRLYFASDRPGGKGKTDLYASHWLGDLWSTPVPLPAPVNTAATELQPAFAADDPDTLYFASDRDGGPAIFRARLIDGEWGEPELVIAGYVGEPALVADGGLLYFVQVLVDDAGVYGSNIWYVERKSP